jgi:protein-tyrosine-phosphatase
VSSPERERLEVSFVCTGNRARSPLAEAFFRRRAATLPVAVSSFGTLKAGGQPALPEAVSIARAHGIDLTEHRAQPLRPGALRTADLVVGFEPIHIVAAVEEGGADESRAFLLLELPELLAVIRPPGGLSAIEQASYTIEEMRGRASRGARNAASLADPYGAPPQAFAEIARVIDAVTGLLWAALFSGEALR